MKGYSKAILLTLVIVSIGILVKFAIEPRNLAHIGDPKLARFRDPAIIGYALSRYQADHDGRLPDRLSNLVPKYIGIRDIKCFFSIQASNNTNLDGMVSSNF